MTKSTLIDSPGQQSEQYCYRLEFRDEHGAQIHLRRLASQEFDRAIQETWFAAFRDGVIDTYSGSIDGARVEPRFTEAGGAESAGFRIRLPLSDGRFYSREFPIGYFSALGTTVRALLHRDSKAEADRTLYFTLSAYLEDTVPTPADSPQLLLERPVLGVPIRTVPIAEFHRLEAWDHPVTDQLPILIHRSVIEDGCEEARQHPDREVGGLLLGNLCQDPETRKVFLGVNCLSSSEETTTATGTSVTFTAASFAAAQKLIQLRSRPGETPESLVGWFHSHPFRFCAECPLPTPPECLRKVLFFSSDDIQLMESTFDQPFMIGLLAGVEPKLEAALGHLPVQLYGWNHGEILPRGFHVFDG